MPTFAIIVQKKIRVFLENIRTDLITKCSSGLLLRFYHKVYNQWPKTFVKAKYDLTFVSIRIVIVFGSHNNDHNVISPNIRKQSPRANVRCLTDTKIAQYR